VSLSRKLLTTGAVSVLSLGVIAATGGNAFAKTKYHGTGSISCSTVTGSLKFKPGLTFSGTKHEKSTFTLKLTGCKTSGSDAPTTGVTGTASGNSAIASNNCSALARGEPAPVTIKWKVKGGTIPTTFVDWPGESNSADSNNDINITFTTPASSSNAPNTGFTGGDSGAGSTAFLQTSENSTAAETACGSKKGLTGLTITSGDVAIS
jgi:hypothetical protein